jgi:hypothetical protein
MTQDEIKAIAIEAGLDPDLWGYERAFEQFVGFLELKFLEHYIKICKKEHERLIHKSNITDSGYTRTVLRQRARSINRVTFDMHMDYVEKKPPSEGG